MTVGDVLATWGEKLVGLFPFRVVNEWQQGVKVRGGRIIRLCKYNNGIRGSGVHFFWPLLEDITHIDCTHEPMETPTQSSVTKDGHSITYTLILRFRVKDARKLMRELFEGPSIVLIEALASAGGLVPTMDYEELRELPELVYRDIRAQLSGWGIALDKVALGTCVECPAYRLIGDSKSVAKVALEGE